MNLQYARTHSEKSYFPSVAFVSKKPSICRGYTRRLPDAATAPDTPALAIRPAPSTAPFALHNSSINRVGGCVSLISLWITTDVFTAVTQSWAPCSLWRRETATYERWTPVSSAPFRASTCFSLGQSSGR